MVRFFFTRLPGLHRKRTLILGGTIVLVMGSFLYLNKLEIGDGNPGSFLLWPDSEYNLNARRINNKFPGVLDQMYLLVRARSPSELGEDRLCHVIFNTDVKYFQMDTYKMVSAFQKFMLEKCSGVVSIFSSYQPLEILNRTLYQDQPKGEGQFTERSFAFVLAVSGIVGTPFSCCPAATTVLDPIVTLYLRDHKGKTINEVIKATDYFISHYPPLKLAKIRLAAGPAAALAATYETIDKSQFLVNFLAFSGVFLGGSLIFGSFMAGAVIAIILSGVNMVALAFMSLAGIGLNLNSLSLCSIAVGIGASYGISFFSGLKAEYRHSGGDLDETIKRTVVRTGKGITFSAAALTGIGLIWTLSKVRFQAEMGIFLSMVSLLHWYVIFLLLPILVKTGRLKFITRA